VAAKDDIQRLRALCDELIQRAVEKPRQAGRLADGVAAVLAAKPAPRRKPPARKHGRRSAPPFDLFEVYREDADALKAQLAALSLEQLRDVVAHYGMDPRRLAMKWKTPERLVVHIYETVEARSRKGDVFRALQPLSSREDADVPEPRGGERP